MGADQAAGAGPKAVYDAFESITTGTPAAIARLNGPRSRSSAATVGVRVTADRSVERTARPMPGKCLAVAATPASARPVAKAVASRPTRAGLGREGALLGGHEGAGDGDVEDGREVDVHSRGTQRRAGCARGTASLGRRPATELGRGATGPAHGSRRISPPS